MRHEDKRWWETAPERGGQRRGVVLWVHWLGKVVWRISEGEQTLAIGGLSSIDPPTPALIERAMQLVHDRAQAQLALCSTWASTSAPTRGWGVR